MKFYRKSERVICTPIYVSNLRATVNKAGFIGQYTGRYKYTFKQYINKIQPAKFRVTDNYLAPIFYRMYFARKCEIASAIKTDLNCSYAYRYLHTLLTYSFRSS